MRVNDVVDAPRKATNVTFEAGLLGKAKALKINISKAAEEGVARAVAARQAEIWLENNGARKLERLR